jgi:hypothetical protein
MAEFDREALVAAANGGQDKQGGNAFWAIVIALPMLGLLAGGVFLTMPSKSSNMIVVEAPTPTETEVVEAADTSAPKKVETPVLDKAKAEAKRLMANSYSDQIDKYQAVNMSLMYCSRVLQYKVISNTQSNYRKRNKDKYERLIELRSAEWKSKRGERRAEAQREADKMMFQAMTGQLPAEALKRQREFQQGMLEAQALSKQPQVRTTPTEVLALLGGEPDLKTCSKLNANLQRGTFDVKIEENT